MKKQNFCDDWSMPHARKWSASFPKDGSLPVYIIVVCLFLMMVMGCAPAGNDGSGQSSALVISFESGTEKTIQPDGMTATSSYVLWGAGPNNAEFNLQTDSSPCTVEDLAPGEWTVTVEAYTSENLLLGMGTAVAVLDNVSTEVTVIITPLEGEGSLDVVVTWDNLLLTSPNVEATMAPAAGGDAVNTSVTMEEGSAAITGSFEAGFYTLDIVLYEGASRVSGCIETVCILSGETSSAAIDLDVAAYFVDGTFVISDNVFRTLDVSVDDFPNQLFSDTGYPLTVTTVPSFQDTTVTWYLDGEVYSASSSIDFGPDVGLHRLDVTVFSGNGLAGGSWGTFCTCRNRIYYGNLLLYGVWEDNEKGVDGLSGVRSLALLANGTRLVAGGYDEDELGLFEVDPVNGELSFLNAFSEVDGHLLERIVSLSTVGTDGPLFVCAKTSMEVLWLRYDAADYSFSYVSAVEGTTYPADCVLDSQNDFLVIAYPEENALHIYSIDDGAGQVTHVQTVDVTGLGTGVYTAPSALALGRNDQWLAASSFTGDCLLVFQRDGQSGELSYHSGFSDGIDGVDGLNGASGLSFAPDADALYATGYYDDSIVLFSYDSDGDVWEYAARYEDETGGIDGMHYPRDVALRGDGSEVYVCSSGDDALSVFSRDQLSHELAYVGTAFNGSDGIVGLDGVRKLAVAPDGENVYAAASNSDAVTLFNGNGP